MNFVVVPADKGNALVVIDKSTYDDKQKEHLNDENTYQKLHSNPVHMLRNKVNKELKDLKEKKELSSEDYRRLYVNTSVTPRFYGTIKIHKENNPIRPIVAFNDSPTYAVAKFLNKILTPFTEESEQKLKNSAHAKELLEAITVPPDYELVSFDVKSLFTSIPQQMALDCVKEVLDGSNVIIGDSNLKPDSVLNLTKICVESTFFQFQQDIYKQIQGTPMGSPVSVVLSEITMQKIENQIIQNVVQE